MTPDPTSDIAATRPPGLSPGRSAAWIAVAVAVLILAWPLIQTRLPPPGDLPEARTDLGYPAWSGRVVGARDLRGRPGPSVVVDSWLGDPPPLEDRVVVVDFWATWCGPCVASIPHMNELAERFGDRASFVAVSNEGAEQFRVGLERIGRGVEDFGASLALDPVGRMAGAAGLQGIPHLLVMSRDGIVRWQGHPRDLDEDLLGAIIDADAASAAGAVGAVESAG
ncbi:MAG: TlpA family protein disulfide reductase [Planctomycetota bacterium]|jgi:thiol-disulfide isomerase/thioredoxin